MDKAEGLSLGLFRCLGKRANHDGGNFTCSFHGNRGSAIMTLSAEEAKYFDEGQYYDFTATKGEK